MLSETLFSAIGDIDEKYIERSEQKTYAGRRSPKRILLIAAIFILAVMLSCTAVLAATGHLNGLIDWFNGIWHYSTGGKLSAMQVQALEDMTYQIGQSATSNGITVTAESVVIGESDIQVLFTANSSASTFNDDLKYTFTDFEAKLIPNPIGEGGPPANSFSVVSNAVDAAGNNVTFILDYSATVPPGKSLKDGGYTMVIDLGGMIGIDKSSSQVQIKYSGEDAHNGGAVKAYGGDWSYQFELPAVGSSAIRFDHATVSADVTEIKPGEVCYGKPENIELHDIAITSSGISYYHKFPAGDKFSVHILIHADLKDGTTVYAGSGRLELDADGVTWHESYSWLVPVGLSNLENVQIGDTTLQVADSAK